MEPYLAVQASRLLRTGPGRVTTMGDAAVKLSTQACRGRISVEVCAKVLATHVKNAFEMRFRVAEVAKDLDRACKAADTRRVNDQLVHDIIQGPCFHERDDETTSRDGGLETFRRIFEDHEMDAAKSTFDEILHSLLAGQTGTAV